MFCSKCGKEINYDSPICLECISAMADEKAAAEEKKADAEPAVNEQQENKPEEPVYTYNPQPQPQPQLYVVPMAPAAPVAPQTGGKSTRMQGFGIALAGTIISAVSIFFMMFAFIGALSVTIMGTLFTMITIGMCVTSLIFGIKSIKTFVSVKREGNPVPIATLILGIETIATAAFVMLYSLLFLGIACIAISEYQDPYYGGGTGSF